jgi:hypothetical protein
MLPDNINKVEGFYKYFLSALRISCHSGCQDARIPVKISLLVPGSYFTQYFNCNPILSRHKKNCYLSVIKLLNVHNVCPPNLHFASQLNLYISACFYKPIFFACKFLSPLHCDFQIYRANCSKLGTSLNFVNIIRENCWFHVLPTEYWILMKIIMKLVGICKSEPFTLNRFLTKAVNQD